MVADGQPDRAEQLVQDAEQLARSITDPYWQAQALTAVANLPQVPEDAAQLADLAALVPAGTVTPVVDRTFPLAEARAAMTYLETEHARAKVVLTVS